MTTMSSDRLRLGRDAVPDAERLQHAPRRRRRSRRRAGRRAGRARSAGSHMTTSSASPSARFSASASDRPASAAAGDHDADRARSRGHFLRPLAIRTLPSSLTLRPARPAWMRAATRPDLTPMSRAVDDLLAILDLEQLEHNLFRGRSPQVGWQRVFGGQVIGQALVAACRTVEGRRPALAARLFPAAGRPRGADHLRGRPHPRRPQLHDPARRGDPARAGDLRHVGLVPCARSPASTTQAPMPDVPPPGGPAERGGDQGGRPAPDAGSGARLLRARAADRAAARRVRALPVARADGAEVQRLDPRHRPPAGRPGDPPMRARLRLGHDAARFVPDRPRPDRVRPRHPGARASTTRSGSTAPSGPTTGSSTPRTARAPPAPAALRAG